MRSFLFKYILEKFTTSIKRSIRRQHAIDSQPFRANGLGPGGIVFFEIFLVLVFSFIFLWDFSIFFFFLSIVDSYLAFLQWKSDLFFSFRKQAKYQELRFFYADRYLYFLQNAEFRCNSYLNELSFLFSVLRVLPFLGALLFYGCGEAFIFILYYGINEMEQVQPKTAILQFLDVTCFSYKADRLARLGDIRKIEDYGDAQLMSHYVREVEAVVTVDHLFIDYRRAQDSNALEDISWHNFPGDLMSMSFRLFGGFFGSLGVYFCFDFGFFALSVVGCCFVFEFFDEFDETYRFLSTVTDYRKLFYRQIVFLPQAIAEVYGYSGLGPDFYLNSVRKEIKNFRKFYEKKVKASDGDADTAFERIGKDVSAINVDFACVLYEKYFGLGLSQKLRLVKSELSSLNFTDKDFIAFLFYLKAREWPLEMQQRIRDELLVYYAYLQEFSRTNDPAVVNREFSNREYQSALLKRTRNVTEAQDLAMRRIFSIEGLASKPNLADFADVLGHEYVDSFVESMQPEVDKEYAELAAKKKEEKLQKRLAKRAKVFKTLHITFNAERHQFLIDYFIDGWPVVVNWVINFFDNLKIQSINAFFWVCWFLRLKIFVIFKGLWKFLFQNFFVNLYTGFFVGIQLFVNFPFLVFFFFFWKRLSADQIAELRRIVLNINKKLNTYYFQGFVILNRNFLSTRKKIFNRFFPRIKIDDATKPYDILRQMYYLCKLYILQWWHEERYIDIFDLMENDEIRHEVIARVMNSPLDAGAAAVSDEDRAWDDPRIVSGYSNRKVTDAAMGISFGSIGLGFLGACLQYAGYSLVAATPYDIFFLDQLWFVGEGLVVFSTHSADWDLFDTWFDSVSYMHLHSERYKIEEYCTYNLQEIVLAMEDEDDTTYIDDYVFDEDVLPFGRRSSTTFNDEDMYRVESYLLKTRRKHLGSSEQFYNLNYSLVFFDFLKLRRLNDFSEFVTGSDYNTSFEYLDRVKRYKVFAARKSGLKYYLRPLDELDKSWQWHKRLYRFWKDYQRYGRGVFRSYTSWNWWWFRRNKRYWGETLEEIQELRPFSIIEAEQRPTYFDFHLLNYPIFTRFYIDDGGDEPLFEDGNEDSQDEMGNGQYVHKNTKRVFWESRYTLFKLDLYWFFERWYAKFCMEKIAMEYYLNKLASLVLKVFMSVISWISKLKNYF